MWACLSIVLVLSACQQEESKEILEQPTSAFSGEGSSGPEVPAGVSFVEIEIPEELQSEVNDGVSETIPFEAGTESGEMLEGYIRITLPPEESDDGKMVKVEISSAFMEAVGASSTFWVDGIEGQPGAAPLFKNCNEVKKGKLRRFFCHA